jgi:UPF0716 protein FxsA
MGALVVIFIVIPLLELWTLVQVARAIGAVPALLVLAAVSIAGAALVKRQGLAVLGRIRGELDGRRMPTEHLADGALLLGAGVLLTVPGFVTDAVGLVLLVPPVRRGVASVLRRRWSRQGRVVTATYTGVIIDTDTSGGDRPSPPPQEIPRP